MPPELDGVPTRRGPLNVLVVGGVGLRKGTPDLLRAAELLGASARFRLVGPLVASPRALAGLPANVEIVGHKPFAELVREYRAADVFLLPSICEGSATSIYEAMSFGLPIVCTPHCGSVVRDGVEGFIVPIRDPEAIARCLSRLAAEPHERAIMGYRAAARAAEFDLEAYGKRLFAVIGREG
jgi:glycosyltransferase involved in cell wall biosynthesis